MINSGGVKIIPEVVEVKLAFMIQDRRFFIAGIPDVSLGEKVVLVVEGNEMDIPSELLDKYECPKEIFFVPEFSETESGKIQRRDTLKLLL